MTPGGVVALETASIDGGSFDALPGGRLATDVLLRSWRREAEARPRAQGRLAYRGATNRFRYFETGGRTHRKTTRPGGAETRT